MIQEFVFPCSPDIFSTGARADSLGAPFFDPNVSWNGYNGCFGSAELGLCGGLNYQVGDRAETFHSEQSLVGNGPASKQSNGSPDGPPEESQGGAPHDTFEQEPLAHKTRDSNDHHATSCATCLHNASIVGLVADGEADSWSGTRKQPPDEQHQSFVEKPNSSAKRAMTLSSMIPVGRVRIAKSRRPRSKRSGGINPTSSLQTRPKPRGPFTDPKQKEETNATRELGACVRCRGQHIRVSHQSLSC